MNKTFMLLSATLISLHATTPTSHAGSTSAAPTDKRQFHLFNPTPDHLMREMSTDRPDLTESPFTVDAGHIQIEMDLVNWTRDNGNDDFAFASTNFKIGLLNSVDLQFVHGGFNAMDGGADGWGDLETRVKINLWGNDDGKTAFALMPFVKWPTASDDVQENDSIEGGIIFPLAIALTESIGLGLMYEIDFNKDASGGGYHADHFVTATVGFELTDTTGMYLESAAVFPGESDGEFSAQINVGFTFSPSANLQFDLGANFGITDSAPEANPFLGMSVRF